MAGRYKLSLSVAEMGVLMRWTIPPGVTHTESGSNQDKQSVSSYTAGGA